MGATHPVAVPLKNSSRRADTEYMAIGRERVGATLRRERRILRVLDALGDEQVRGGLRSPQRPGGDPSAAVRIGEALPRPWHVFHDVDLGGESAEVVAVGPSGVFTIDVVRHRGAVFADPGGLWTRGRRDPNNGVLVGVLRRRRRLEQMLGVSVRPVLVVVCAALTGRVAWRIPAVPPDEITAALASSGRAGIGWHRARQAIDSLQALTR